MANIHRQFTHTWPVGSSGHYSISLTQRNNVRAQLMLNRWKWGFPRQIHNWGRITYIRVRLYEGKIFLKEPLGTKHWGWETLKVDKFPQTELKSISTSRGKPSSTMCAIISNRGQMENTYRGHATDNTKVFSHKQKVTQLHLWFVWFSPEQLHILFYFL